MIESLQARDNTTIFTWEGKYLCSRVSPLKEASAWVLGNASQISSSKSIVVLGLGNGFHVVELRARYPYKKIYVIETEINIISNFKKRFPIESANIHMVHVKDENTLLRDSYIKKLVKEFYIILDHKPSLQLFPELKVYQSWLLGRTYESLQWLLEARKLSSEVVIESLGINDLNSECISLINLQNCLSKTESKEGKKLNYKINALKELLV